MSEVLLELPVVGGIDVMCGQDVSSMQAWTTSSLADIGDFVIKSCHPDGRLQDGVHSVSAPCFLAYIDGALASSHYGSTSLCRTGAHNVGANV